VNIIIILVIIISEGVPNSGPALVRSESLSLKVFVHIFLCRRRGHNFAEIYCWVKFSRNVYKLPEILARALGPYCMDLIRNTQQRMHGATENAGLENAGPIYKGGKRGTGKHGTIIQGVENAGPLAMEHRSDKCSKTNIQFIST